MDLESPLRTLASPVEAEALRVLAGADTEFTAPQVQRLAESASPFGIRKALQRLADSGLVIADRYGNTQTIEAAVDARSRLLDKIEGLVRQEEGVDAYLYGSIARRESSPDSDVDVLLVFPDSYDNEEIIDIAYGLSISIEGWTGNHGHINNVTRSGLADMVRRRDSLVESLQSEAIPLIGPDFDQLVREVQESGRG
jgi:predicted nucleotidyltransferase